MTEVNQKRGTCKACNGLTPCMLAVAGWSHMNITLHCTFSMWSAVHTELQRDFWEVLPGAWGLYGPVLTVFQLQHLLHHSCFAAVCYLLDPQYSFQHQGVPHSHDMVALPEL